MELNDEIYNRITQLCEEGDSLAEDEYFDEAVEKYNEALELLPEPVYAWEAATWIFTALGDAYYMNDEYRQAVNSLNEALKCPDGLGN